MSVDMNGKMVNCPFMDGSSSFCQMSVSEHISQWKQFFTVIREKIYLLYLSFFIFLFYTLFLINNKLYDKLQSQRSRNYLYRHKPEIKLFDNLVIAFSQGIIHPRIYA